MADGDGTDTVSEELSEDEMTRQDLPLLGHGYQGPPTIEERLSPFARDPDSGRVELRSNTPTAPGMPSLSIGGFAAPKFVAAPEVMPPDGPTSPDGVPMMTPMNIQAPQIIGAPSTDPAHELTWEQHTDPDAGAHLGWGDSGEMPTARFDNPSAPRRGEMPDPNLPKVQVSKSMEIQVGDLDTEALRRAKPTDVPTVALANPRRQVAMQPTEVALPALKRRKKKREGSDWPLIVGLVGVVLLIAGLVTLVVLGVLGQLGI